MERAEARLVVDSCVKAGQTALGTPGQPLFAGGEPPATKLFQLIVWIRGRLERLEVLVASDYTRSSLHSLVRACDPETNPRLRGALDALGIAFKPEERTWTLRRVPRSANQLLRSHWGARDRDRESWISYVRSVCGRPRKQVEMKIRLELIVHRRTCAKGRAAAARCYR